MVEANMSMERIWNESPLSREDTKAIIAAPDLPIAISSIKIEILEGTLALFALAILEIGVQRNSVTRNEWEDYRKHIAALIRLEVQTAMAINKPPPIPRDWLDSFALWLNRNEPETQRGRPSSEMDELIFPKLLAYYSLVYNREPAATVGGPTERFVAEFFSRLRKGNARFAWRHESVVPRPDPTKIIPVTEGERLRSRIKGMKSNLDKVGVLNAMREIATLLRAGTDDADREDTPA